MESVEIKTIETFFKLHYRKLVSFSFIVVKDTLVAEDLVMELFLNLWEKQGHGLDKIKDIKAYHYRALYINSCKYLEEKNRMEKSCQNYSYLFNAIELGSDTPVDLEIHEEIKKLSPAHKQIICLYYFDGLTLEKIACYLKIPLNTVKSHKRRAEAYMMKTLQKPNLSIPSKKKLRSNCNLLTENRSL